MSEACQKRIFVTGRCIPSPPLYAQKLGVATNHRQPAIFTGCLQLRVIPATQPQLLAGPTVSAQDKSPEFYSRATMAFFFCF